MKLSLRVLLFVLLAGFFLVLLGGIQEGIGVLPPEIGLAQWGPGLAGLAMMMIFRRSRPGSAMRFRGCPASDAFVAFLVPLAMGVILWGILKVFPIQGSSGKTEYSMLWLLIWMPFGALGEEIGWRGYLQPLLSGVPALASATIVGLLWMPIHVSIFTNGPVYVLLFALLLIDYSIIIYGLSAARGFNVIQAGLFHWGINLANLLVFNYLNSTTFMAVNAGLWTGAVIILVIVKPSLFKRTG